MIIYFKIDEYIDRPLTESQIISLRKRLSAKRDLVILGGLIFTLAVTCFSTFLFESTLVSALTAIVAFIPCLYASDGILSSVRRYQGKNTLLIVEGHIYNGTDQIKMLEFITLNEAQKKQLYEFKSPKVQRFLIKILELDRPLVQAEWRMVNVEEVKFQAQWINKKSKQEVSDAIKKVW